MLGNIIWLFVFLVICLFFAKSAVFYFIKKYQEEKTYKCIPAISSFVVFIYTVAILYFSVDAFVSNLLFLLLDVLALGFSIVICVFSLLIAGFHDYRKIRDKGEKEEKL